MSREKEYTILLKLIFKLISSVSGSNIPNGGLWKNEAQVLAEKIFKHLASANTLRDGSTFQDSEQDEYYFIDHSSISIIIRSAFETYLAFYFIFLNQDEQISIFRHKIWTLAGLMDRSKMFAGSPETEDQLRAESISIQELESEIRQDPLFVAETKADQIKILKGDWRGNKPWHDLAVNAGFHRKYFKDIYKHLCGHSHSSFISVLQTRDANSIQSQKSLTEATMQIGILLMAHLSFSYTSLFKNTSEILSSDEEIFQIAHKWNIRAEDQNSIYGPAD